MAKSQKLKDVSTRVKINTMLLLLMSLLFGIITLFGLQFMKSQMDQLSYLTSGDMPQICFESEDESHGGRDASGAYICSTEQDENGNSKHLTSNEDYALFLQNNLVFVSNLESLELMTILCALGSMLTIGSLIATLVYWNHNR